MASEKTHAGYSCQYALWMQGANLPQIAASLAGMCSSGATEHAAHIRNSFVTDIRLFWTNLVVL